MISLLIQMTDSPKGDVILLFALLRPVECGAYSSGVSGKQKNKNLCVLSVSGVTQYFCTIFDPFRMIVNSPCLEQ